MQTKAVRLYGKNDLRLETFELPPIEPDEILARVVTDSICMSSYKAAVQGADHKRVPNDVAENPIIIGHELCGVLEQVGQRWAKDFKPGQRFTIQPALDQAGGELRTPGYSFPHLGGAATYVILPREVMERNCLLPYEGEAFFLGSLAEPMSCIIGGFHATYHAQYGVYTHEMGIRKGGNCALLAGCGPMGLGAIDYAVNGPVQPSLLVVTDLDEQRIQRAKRIYTPEAAQGRGVRLVYLNARDPEVEAQLRALTEGKGYDDVLVYAPVKPVVEMADRLLGYDGCLNFFAGPIDPKFSAEFNFYNVHYSQTHIVGTSGGNTEDMKEAIDLMAKGQVNPAGMITHVGGLDAVPDTTLNLPNIPGGKKLIYTGIQMPLTPVDGFEALAQEDARFLPIWKAIEQQDGMWNAKAEQLLLALF